MRGECCDHVHQILVCIVCACGLSFPRCCFFYLLIMFALSFYLFFFSFLFFFLFLQLSHPATSLLANLTFSHAIYPSQSQSHIHFARILSLLIIGHTLLPHTHKTQKKGHTQQPPQQPQREAKDGTTGTKVVPGPATRDPRYDLCVAVEA